MSGWQLFIKRVSFGDLTYLHRDKRPIGPDVKIREMEFFLHYPRNRAD